MTDPSKLEFLNDYAAREVCDAMKELAGSAHKTVCTYSRERASLVLYDADKNVIGARYFEYTASHWFEVVT